ncbi:SRPBCC family protein [Richelia sinica]|nr:SRPBCC family protein [Richelia sinica]MBD2666973.1 SRPBCC family protein [Richelia sinica FACHB-800]
MKYLWILGASVAVLALLLWMITKLLPDQVIVVRRTEINASPAVVFQTVTDVAGQTRWRKDIKAVRMPASGRSWTEETIQGTVIDFQVLHQQTNSRFEIEFISTQGFCGTWTGIFTPYAQGTMLEITETIAIRNPMVKIISRIFAVTDHLVDTYIMELKAAVENTENPIVKPQQ